LVGNNKGKKKIVKIKGPETSGRRRNKGRGMPSRKAKTFYKKRGTGCPSEKWGSWKGGGLGKEKRKKTNCILD